MHLGFTTVSLYSQNADIGLYASIAKRADELSMEPFFIPVIKQLIRSVSYEAAVDLAQSALRLSTVREIKSAVFDTMRALGVIELLDMYQ